MRTADRATKKQRADFSRARKVERKYAAQLRSIARHVGEIVRGFGGIARNFDLEHALRRYADLIEPWARAAGERMVAEVNRRDEANWSDVGKDIGLNLRREIATAPTGARMRELLAEQVDLIKSLPTDAAKRVHDLTVKGITEGTRADTIAAEIMRTGEVAEARAKLIARTEVGRAATTLTQARSEHIGSEGYIWRTSEDSDVRPSHRRMEGRFVRWDEPPTLDGLKGHAGALPNCRCYPEPVLSASWARISDRIARRSGSSASRAT